VHAPTKFRENRGEAGSVMIRGASRTSDGSAPAQSAGTNEFKSTNAFGVSIQGAADADGTGEDGEGTGGDGSGGGGGDGDGGNGEGGGGGEGEGGGGEGEGEGGGHGEGGGGDGEGGGGDGGGVGGEGGGDGGRQKDWSWTAWHIVSELWSARVMCAGEREERRRNAVDG